MASIILGALAVLQLASSVQCWREHHRASDRNDVVVVDDDGDCGQLFLAFARRLLWLLLSLLSLAARFLANWRTRPFISSLPFGFLLSVAQFRRPKHRRHTDRARPGQAKPPARLGASEFGSRQTSSTFLSANLSPPQLDSLTLTLAHLHFEPYGDDATPQDPFV